MQGLGLPQNSTSSEEQKTTPMFWSWNYHALKITTLIVLNFPQDKHEKEQPHFD
jgi:hypothetical protein